MNDLPEPSAVTLMVPSRYSVPGPATPDGMLACTEAELIEFYTRAQLRRFGGDKKKAASAMGVTYATVYNRMRRWGGR